MKQKPTTTILSNTKKEISITEFKLPLGEYPKDIGYIGVDPGTVHLGLAGHFPDDDHLVLWEITMDRQDTTKKRIDLMLDILNYFVASEQLDYITIEGAGYMSSQYRQVELEDIRCATIFFSDFCYSYSPKLEIVPPNSIRKIVFGSAKIKNTWEGIPDNAAAALACALYPIMKEE